MPECPPTVSATTAGFVRFPTEPEIDRLASKNAISDLIDPPVKKEKNLSRQSQQFAEAKTNDYQLKADNRSFQIIKSGVESKPDYIVQRQ